MVVTPKNGPNGWALKILIAVATVLWTALLTFLVIVARAQGDIKEDQAAMKTSITNIEQNVRAIVSARAAEATEATNTNRQRIQQLEGREQAQDQRRTP